MLNEIAKMKEKLEGEYGNSKIEMMENSLKDNERTLVDLRKDNEFEIKVAHSELK